MAPIHLLFILVIDLCWAFNIIAVKVAVDAAGPLTAVTLRYAIALLCTIPFIRWIPGRMTLVLTTALLAGAAFMLFVNLSLAVTDNVAALAIAGQVGAPFSLLLAVIFLGERIRWVRTAGIALAFGGICVMGFDPAIWVERLGVFLTLVASLFWAIGSLLFRQLQGVHVMNIHGWLALISVPVLGACAFVFEPGGLAAAPGLPLNIWLWIGFSAIFSSLVGHAGMSWLLQKYPVTTIVPLTLPTPLISAAIAVVYFDNPVTTGLIIGGIVSFVGVAIITLRSAEKEPEIAETWVKRARR
ncbi:MAG: DMT family transporter [Pacificimonas sp.]|jgi:O-acetylserine/cysteine efflux transporter|nr:DMT family transporter [Pacificimonas sp.]